MHTQLEQLKTLWSPDNGAARDEAGARALADTIVAEHPDWFEDYTNLAVPDLVRNVDLFRTAGMENEQWKVEAWLLHKFLPQNIGGEAVVQVRVSAEATPTDSEAN